MKTQKTFAITVNPTKYNHPHYNPGIQEKPANRVNLRKHLHKICFSVAIAAFTVPLLSNPIFKEDDPDTQRNIKLASYSLMLAAAAVGYANEQSTKTLETRRYHDMKENADYALNRHAIKLKFGRDYQTEVIKSDLLTLTQAQNAGAYGLPYYPQTLAPIAMSRFSPPQQQGGTSTDMGSLDPNVFQLPTTASSDEINSVNSAYDYVSDKSKRNYRGLLVYGDTGDNKTTMLHYVMNRWLKREPDSVFYVCDRKFFSEDNPIWRGNWCGLPVYSDLKLITSPGVPHPSVYAKFQPDLEEWLNPVYKLLENRTGESKATASPEDKLINPVTGKNRPVVILIDDATMIISGYGREKATRVNRILDELTTLGRSADISVVFISHANTASGTGLSSETLRMLAPLVGTGFVGDSQALQWSKKPISPVGIQKCLENQTGIKRFFATAWVDNPFIPPAPYRSSTGMLDCLIPELVKMWHQTCPDGFLEQDYHQLAIKRLGYYSVQDVRLGKTPKTIENTITEREALVQLRDWSSQIDHYSQSDLLAKFSQISGQPISELGQYGEQLTTIVSMPADEFQKLT